MAASLIAYFEAFKPPEKVLGGAALLTRGPIIPYNCIFQSYDMLHNMPFVVKAPWAYPTAYLVNIKLTQTD